MNQIHNYGAKNPVRFVQVRRLFADIWRISKRVVRQSDLVSRVQFAEQDEGEAPKQLVTASNPKYVDPARFHVGDKWGRYLRASDIFFELLERYGNSFVPLREIAKVRYGIKSGCDAFFFPRDITAERLDELNDKDFFENYGLKREIQNESAFVKLVMDRCI